MQLALENLLIIILRYFRLQPFDLEILCNLMRLTQLEICLSPAAATRSPALFPHREVLRLLLQQRQPAGRILRTGWKRDRGSRSATGRKWIRESLFLRALRTDESLQPHYGNEWRHHIYGCIGTLRHTPGKIGMTAIWDSYALPWTETVKFHKIEERRTKKWMKYG